MRGDRSSQVAKVIVSFSQLANITGGQESTDPTWLGSTSSEQAVLARAFAALQDEEQEADVLCAPNDQAAALLQTFLSERAVEEAKVEEAFAGALEAQFDRRDIRWIREFIPWARSKLGRANRADRPPLMDTPASLPARANLALLGDWGTGLYGAPACARSIERDGDYHAVVHLGDVYYSGSEREIDERFLAFWPKVEGAISRACNSNHEMYSGGGPLFRRTLPAFGQPATVFTLQNEDWVFAGLDTAWQDHDLDDDQVRWLDQTVQQLDGRKLVLLSHHQLFSRVSGEQGPKLGNRLAGLLNDRVLAAWYWGHEHRCVLYDAHPRWGFRGRCVGHGGFPYFRGKLRSVETEKLLAGQCWRVLPAQGDVPRARVLDGPNEYLGDRADRYGPNGYLRVELDGPNLREVVIAPDGTRLWEAEWS
jgi:hypothetical protein